MTRINFIISFSTLMILTRCSFFWEEVPEPLSIILLPDTQRYSEKYPEIFLKQTHWIREERHSRNIVFVTHVGDVVQNWALRNKEWKAADRALSVLDGLVPWGIAIGNHDYDGENLAGFQTFLRFFGPQRFERAPWYGGSSENGLNSYQIIQTSPSKLMFLHLELDAPEDALRWAQDVLDLHPGVPTVVTTHVYLIDRHERRTGSPYLNKEEGNSGEQIWRRLIAPNPQVFMVLCGHYSDPGEYHQISKNEEGQKVIEVLADYQGRDRGGNGWLRIIEIHPADRNVRFRTFSPVLDEFETDENSEFSVADIRAWDE